MEDFFSWVYENYTKELDIHMTSLMVSLAGINPITGEEYRRMDKNALLVLPIDDKAFPEEAQRELIHCLPNGMIARVSGGHTAVLYKVDSFVESTRRFLETVSGLS
ncbi:MAG: hypothetical protein NC427_02240 [Ruminococcus flavefaciens]|nr:hypothetical protein [Ruminococcus flavefaciens]